jgi:hypothetical protein
MSHDEFHKLVAEEVQKSQGGGTTFEHGNGANTMFNDTITSNTETITMPIHFQGTLAHFSTPEGSKWTPGNSNSKLVHVGVPTDLAGDFVKDKNDATMKRRVLSGAVVTHFGNSSPVPIGIKFSGLPVTNPCATHHTTDVDLLIPPETKTLTQIDHKLYESHFDPSHPMKLINSGWGNITKQSIENSILSKMPVAWKLKTDSPIAEFLNYKGKINSDNFSTVGQSSAPEAYLVRAPVAEEATRELLHELSQTPFHNPSGISATIHRLDAPWTEPKIAGSFNHPSLAPDHQPENICANLVLKYDLYPVNN